MIPRYSTPRLLVFVLLAGWQDAKPQNGPISITLTPTTSPGAAEPGVTNISVTGLNFPAGTIPAANVTVSLKPVAGGTAVTTAASAVATIVGTTRRVSFTVPLSTVVSVPTSYAVSIAGTTSSNVTFASSNAASLTINPLATLTSLSPNTGQPGQSLTVAVIGSFSNFLQGATVASFESGITVNSTSVTDATHASVNITISSSASASARSVSLVTGAETATLTNGFTITAANNPPTISDFNPKSGSVGTLVTISGISLQPASGTAAQISVAKQGGGTLAVAASATSSISLTFVIPAGAMTGVVVLALNGATATTNAPFVVTPSSRFTISANPPSGNLIQGQSVAYSVQLATTNGFNQLAQLSLSGLPSGVTATFKPANITMGQISVLTLSAPTSQTLGSTSLVISAAATVDGLAVSQSASATLAVVAPTTALLGRTVVSDAVETPLAGVTITTLGKDGNGNTTGCVSHTTVSDAAGNFTLTNLPPSCTGPQLIGFDGTTATAPPGKFAGVNLVFTLNVGQVTVSPVLVHLPRIDNVETFSVTQNSPTNQSYAFTSIPGLSVTVYAGTTFTMPDGSMPNPFLLAAVQVPVDRLPDAKPNVPTMLRAFIVAFQPANATTNEPVAVYFPNTLNTPPGTDMALMTLDPTHGQMVPYGTGSVSSDGTQIVPDPDPAHPGHLYGLIHFDWHGPMPPPPNQVNPGPPGGGSGSGSQGGPANGPGPGPGNGSGPGGTTPPTWPPQTQTDPPIDPPPPPCSTCPCNASSRILEAPNSGGAAEAGDPVDLFSGIQVITNTDIGFAGSRGSIALARTYRSLTTSPGPFGIGTGHTYALTLDTSGFVRSAEGIINLVMPDGNQYPFYRTVTGTFINTALPTFSGAVLSNPSTGVYKLRWRNGATYLFQSTSLGALEAFLTSIIDRNGNTISITLNPSQPLQITQITDPVGRSLVFSYDGTNRITLISDPIGRIVQYAYNSQGTLATMTDPAGGVTRYTYDSHNNLLTVTDPRGIVQAQNTLDSVGRVIQQVRPDGGVLNFNYTLLNPLASSSQVMEANVTDSVGVSATYRFNPNGFVTDVTATQGQTRHLERAAGSNVLMSATESSTTTAYTYDANGNILTGTDATGLTTKFTYDAVFNQVTSISDPLNNVTHFTYDPNGNLLTQTDANGNTTSYKYDATGLLLQSTDALNQTTTFTYDSLGNLTAVTDPLGNITSSVYDGISRRVSATDALGRKTSFTYDSLGRLLTTTDAKGGVTTSIFDSDGNLLSVKDAKGNATTFTYDVMNRLVTRTDGLGKIDMRTYDANGNLTQFVDRRRTTSNYAYDNVNRLTTETYSDATVSRTYDSLGRVVQVSDSASGVFTFAYDPAGRLTSNSTPVGTITYTYDGRGGMALKQVVGQPAELHTYDAAGNLTSATMPQASASFAYNPRNQISTISRANGVTSSFAYDAASRLLSISHAKGLTMIETESYGYDAVGNRNSHATTIGQPLVTQATVNTYNSGNQLTQFGSVPDGYDANGNLAQEGSGTTYSWDGRNRINAIATEGGQTTSFTYDFAGNLIQQTDSGPSLNITRSFVLDDLTNVGFEAASDGSSYLVLGGRSIDGHLAVGYGNGQTEYGLSDSVNSTIITTDSTGRIEGRFNYEPFGQTMANNSSYPFQYTGREQVLGNLYYYRARFYNTQTGRFISEDPIGFGGGPNLYRYARNNPTRFKDPRGTSSLSTIFGTTKGIYDTNQDLNKGNLPGALWDLTSLGADLAEIDLGPPGWIISGYLFVLDHPDLGSTWFNGWGQRAYNDLCPYQPPGTQGDTTGIFQ